MRILPTNSEYRYSNPNTREDQLKIYFNVVIFNIKMTNIQVSYWFVQIVLKVLRNLQNYLLEEEIRMHKADADCKNCLWNTNTFREFIPMYTIFKK